MISPVIYGDTEYARQLAEAALNRPEFDLWNSMAITSALASIGELDLAKTSWAGLLTWQEYSLSADMGLVADLLRAGVADWAAERMRELIDDPATAPRRRLRLRQMLAVISVTV